MLKRTILSCVAVCLALTASCGGGASLRNIKKRSLMEAELLKTEAANLQDGNIANADKYFELAKSGKSGSQEMAIYYADMAAALYREALARQSLAASQASLGEAETALKASMGQVTKYERIMMEISAGSKAAPAAGGGGQ